ncbi:MAG TPA: GtrA family protein [Chitinophagaceae bacterium]|nr:GtrA family protein [Chitinophagaceae bacterium]
MIQFLKAQASSLIATVADFLVTIVCKEILGMWYLLANILGVISGGLVNFWINRDWVFNGREKAVRYQAIRYFVIWTGNLLLNAGGVWLLTQYSSFNYLVSKTVVSLIVGWTYNYFLQKNFVFK